MPGEGLGRGDEKPAETKAPVGSSVLHDRHLLFRLFFLIAFGYLLYQLVLIFAPFAASLVTAATLVFIFQPIHRLIKRWTRDSPNLAASLSTAVLLLLIIIPAGTLGWLLARDAADSIPTLKTWVQRYHEGGATAVEAELPDAIARLLERADTALGSWGVDVEKLTLSALEAVGTKLSAIAADFVRNIPSALLDVAIMGVGIFFFLRDGARWTRVVVDVVPLETQHKDLLLRRLDETLAAVIRGQLVTAAVQAVLGGIGFSIAGLPSPLLLAFATGILSLIPFVGAVGVWVPASLYLIFTGPRWAAIFLIVWGTLVVSLADNVLKPYLIGGKARIPAFLLLFGILGGLELYGILGIIMGPVLLGLITTFLAIYREELTTTTAAPVRAGDSAGG